MKKTDDVEKILKKIKKDQTLSERALEILYYIKKSFQTGQKINSQILSEKLEVSVSTISRALKELTKHGLIEWKNSTYKVTQNFQENKFYNSKTKQNLALVAAIKGVLIQYKNTPLLENVEKLICKLEPKASLGINLFENVRIAVPPLMEYKINEENWDKILRAMTNNRKIQFRYKYSQRDKNELRIFRPYQVLLNNGDVYAWGYSEKQKSERLYLLNGLEGITITKDSFELPEDFDFSKRCGGGRLGAFQGSFIKQYKLEFFGTGRDWIKNHKLADDQKFEDTENSTIINFSSSQETKVLELVLQFGMYAHPIEPESLVEKWKKNVQEMTKFL